MFVQIELMKRAFTLFFSLLFFNMIFAQNLVPNPSFEQYKRRPSAMLDEGLEFTRAVPGWVSPNRASPDFITARFRSSKVKTVPPHSGENLVGIVVQGAHWAEYASAKLKEPLEVGKKYYVEFWISAPPYYNKIPTGTPLFNDHFGMLFDKRLYFTNTKIIKKRPQIIAHQGEHLEPNHWKKINGSFVADQPATHFYIGQFFNPELPKEIIEGYIFIDDIFIEKIDKEAEQFEPSKTYQIKGKVASIVMENIYFETNKYEILPESYQELDKLVKIMKRHSTMTINIQGHTDSEGNADYNLTLSENRANSVHDYLVKNGIQKSRLTFEGKGLSAPVAANDSSEGRQKNRRVEFVTKTQDTIGQGVVLADLAYKFSKNILAQPHKLVNIGKDERHFDCESITVKSAVLKNQYQEQLKSFGQYKSFSAKKTILEQSKDLKVVQLQTSSVHPEYQLFILELLEDFYQQGFTHIGFDDLKKIASINQLGYPTFDIGEKFQQPIYGELIRQGHALGFKFFNLTPTESETQKALNILKKQKFAFQDQTPKSAAQNWAKAMNLNRLLKKNPNAKVLLLNPQIDKKKTGNPSTIAHWLKKIVKLDMLAIGQSSTHQPCAEKKEPILNKIKISRPSIYKKRSIPLVPYGFDSNGESFPMHDLHVFHPENKFSNNRPAYLSKNGNRLPATFNIDKFKMNYPCLVFAYKKGEDVNKAIPIDVIELSDNQDVTPLILPKGTYEIVLRDNNKRKILEVDVN